MPEHRNRILIVEDHEPSRSILQRIFALTLDGWDVVEAGTIGEGLGQLDPPPECIVLDLQLPDGRGESILRRVREGHLPTRVVVNTGMTDDAPRMDAVRDLEPEAVIHKPLDAAGLQLIYQTATGDACPA